MKLLTIIALSLILVLGQATAQNRNRASNQKTMKPSEQTEQYTFPLSDKVTRQHVSYKNRYGITISADLYLPKNRRTEPLAALAVARLVR